jgi:hypothetical protein
MFLQGLPCTLRTMLGEQEPGDIRNLAAKADRLWASHKQQAHDLVANVETAEEQPAQQIAVVQQKKKKRTFRPASKKSRASPPAVGGKQVTSSLTHSEQARVCSGLCYSHWTFRAKAIRCEAPCNWTEN